MIFALCQSLPMLVTFSLDPCCQTGTVTQHDKHAYLIAVSARMIYSKAQSMQPVYNTLALQMWYLALSNTILCNALWCAMNCRFVSKSAAIAVYTLAGFSLLGTLGVDTKPLVAGLGVGGFTVGFALRVRHSRRLRLSVQQSCRASAC